MGGPRAAVRRKRRHDVSKFIDLASQRFGRLTVIERAENSNAGQAKWLCKCDCGNHKVVAGYQLRGGYIQSCGCLQRDRASESSKKFNSFRISGEVVHVKLSNSDKEMMVDLDVWEQAKVYCWSESRGYAGTNMPGRRGQRRKKGAWIKFHIYAFPDCPSGMVRDHINGNTLDNRRTNIRFVTAQQNNHNHGRSKVNTSGYTGVRWEADRKKWLARIKINDKAINLGRYARLEDAIAAREAAEIKYFGEYRRKEHTD